MDLHQNRPSTIRVQSPVGIMVIKCRASHLPICRANTGIAVGVEGQALSGAADGFERLDDVAGVAGSGEDCEAFLAVRTKRG